MRRLAATMRKADAVGCPDEARFFFIVHGYAA